MPGQAVLRNYVKRSGIQKGAVGVCELTPRRLSDFLAATLLQRQPIKRGSLGTSERELSLYFTSREGVNEGLEC